MCVRVDGREKDELISRAYYYLNQAALLEFKVRKIKAMHIAPILTKVFNDFQPDVKLLLMAKPDTKATLFFSRRHFSRFMNRLLGLNNRSGMQLHHCYNPYCPCLEKGKPLIEGEHVTDLVTEC